MHRRNQLYNKDKDTVSSPNTSSFLDLVVAHNGQNSGDDWAGALLHYCGLRLWAGGHLHGQQGRLLSSRYEVIQ